MFCNDHYKGSKWDACTKSNIISLSPKYAYNVAYTTYQMVEQVTSLC